MSLLSSGIYIDDGDKAYEIETSYYLNFHIISALASIDYLLNFGEYSQNAFFKNKAQYYHFYLDHLIFSLGQIVNRFKFNINKVDKNDRRVANCKNYQFSEVDFPILSNKDFRNTIEHIDEHNAKIIKKHRGVGGFNYIDSETEQALCNTLLNDRKKHPYTLNLIDKEIYIEREDNELTLNICSLQDELKALKKNVDSFYDMIK